MESTTKGNKGKSARMFDDMAVNLLSVGQLCNDGCTVAFMPTKHMSSKNNRVIMSAPQKETQWHVGI